MARTNDECSICGAPYHVGMDPQSGNKKTLKLNRTMHLAHARKRANGKASIALNAHVERLEVDFPCGAVK